MRLTTALAIAAIGGSACSPSDAAADECQDAVAERDAAEGAFQTAADAHDEVNAELERIPMAVTPPGSEFPDINPERQPWEAEARRLGTEVRAQLERITIIVAQNPDCFSAGERADAEKLARRLKEAAGE